MTDFNERYIAARKAVIAADLGAFTLAGKWHEVFGNDKPIYLEIGMGKGNFILQHALEHPENNYIGVEIYSSVLLRAIQKRAEEPYDQLDNICFLRMNAAEMERVFAKGEIYHIYLNFSDPWPKKRYAKRRLTSRQFLARYVNTLRADGIVEFKTDNNDLFDFSLEEAREAGWEVLSSTRDLHNDPVLCEGNIMTEYEAKFSAMGMPINKMIIRQRQEV